MNFTRLFHALAPAGLALALAAPAHAADPKLADAKPADAKPADAKPAGSKTAADAKPATGTTATFWGQAAWILTTPGGATIAIDPWLDNPIAPKLERPAKLDAILLTHGHFDHVGNAVDLAKKTGAKIIATLEGLALVRKTAISLMQTTTLLKCRARLRWKSTRRALYSLSDRFDECSPEEPRALII